MKFGVLVCPKCKHALGVNLQYKTTSCPYCNNKLIVGQKNIKHKSNSEKELMNMISTINQEFGNICEPKQGLEISDFGTEIFDSNDPNDVVNQEKSNGTVYEALDPYQRIAMKHREKKESLEFIIEIVKALASELGEFTVKEFQKLLLACKFNENKAENYLEQLKNYNIIYEPQIGIFKILDD